MVDPDPSVARREDDLPIGAMLGSSYRVIRLIGYGGMGAIYEVEHVRMQKRFAAKVLRPEIASDRDAIARLELEAISASRIEHPNIVQVVNFDQSADGRVYLIEELLEGHDLGALQGKEPLPPATALAIASQVAAALEAAHENGIVHRDLKPANIFLARKSGEVLVKVLDFGLSKFDGSAARRLTQAGYVLGTPLYMSPEHAQSKSTLDARADIYSLGVILFEMLTGRPPFDGDNILAVLFQHVHQPPPNPTAFNPALAEPLSKLVLRALEKEPSDRYSSMAELGEAIRAAAVALGLEIGRIPAPKGELPAARARAERPALTSPFATLDPGGLEVPRSSRLFVGAGAACVVLSCVLAYVFSDVPLPPTVAPSSPVIEHRPSSAPAPLAGARVVQEPPVASDPELVEVTLDSEPPGAIVRLRGSTLGRTPTRTALPRSEEEHVFTFEKEGFSTVAERLSPNMPRSLKVTLASRPAPNKRTPGTVSRMRLSR